MNNKKEKLLNIVVGILALSITSCVILYIAINSHKIINSDFSAESVLAKMLANTNQIITRGWYYSSELRILHTQLITAPLFKLFDDWNIVRMLSIIITNGLLVVAYFRFIRVFNIKSRWIVYLTAMFMIIPVSSVYLDIINVGMFYIPHYIMELVILNIYITIIKRNESFRFDKARIILFLILALISGLSGIRYILVIQFPLFITSLIMFLMKNKEIISHTESYNYIKEWKNYYLKKELILGTLSMFFAGVGYILNTFIVRKFIKYAVFGNVMFKTDNDHIYSVFEGLNQLSGYKNDVRMLSFAGLMNLIAVGLVIIVIFIICVLLKKHFNKCDNIAIMCTVMLTSFIINTFIFCTTDEYTSRFYLPVIMWIIPCIAVYLNGEKRLLLRRGIAVLLVIIYATLGSGTIRDSLNVDVNSNRVEYISYLEENDLNYGYSTIWNSNITTELTNGKVEIGNIVDVETMEPFQFLTKSEYFKNKEYRANNPVFILMTYDEYLQVSNCKVLSEGNMSYNDGIYVIYTYLNRSVLDSYIDKYSVELE